MINMEHLQISGPQLHSLALHSNLFPADTIVEIDETNSYFQPVS